MSWAKFAERVLRRGAPVGSQDAGLDLRKPLLTAAGAAGQSLGVVVIGTAQGDLHDIGKNLVGMMLEGAGFKVHNLGRDVAPEKFVAAVEEHGAQIVGISALMTTTMPGMKRTIDALQNAGLRERVKVMIGGAPVTQAYCDEIGADGYAKDSTLAVVRAKALMTSRRSRVMASRAAAGNRRQITQAGGSSSSTAATHGARTGSPTAPAPSCGTTPTVTWCAASTRVPR